MKLTQTSTVGVTGSNGLLGWHLQCRLLSLGAAYSTVAADRGVFRSDSELDDFVRQCDVIVHFAGMNRGDQDELESINKTLAQRLIAALERTQHRPHLLFSSSTHEDRDTAYGRSKRFARDAFRRWATREGALYTHIVLPHVFGESGRPFYNSVVSTFCHQIAKSDTPKIERNGQLELLHAQQVAAIIVRAVEGRSDGELRPLGQPVEVSELLARLQDMAATYSRGIIPNVGNQLDLQLFNTYRSYLYPENYPFTLPVNADDRGDLFEAVKSAQGGQTFLSTTRPGVTRGEHFHFEKVERFLVIRGQATIRVRRLFDHHVDEFVVSGHAPAAIDMPTLHTHSITNTGDEELLTLFWSNEIFDPDNPDTYQEAVSTGRSRLHVK